MQSLCAAVTNLTHRKKPDTIIFDLKIKNRKQMNTFNSNCRDGLGKLQNLSENPSLEASSCQEDQLKVTRMGIRMRKMVMVRRRRMVGWAFIDIEGCRCCNVGSCRCWRL